MRSLLALLALQSALSSLPTCVSSSSSSSSSLSSSFAFDGSTSDMAQQLYWRAQANDSAAAISLADVPTEVQTRLDALSIDFDRLPGIVQRAVLWDSGFVLSPKGAALKVWTLRGFGMADLAVPYDEYALAGCVAKTCAQADGSAYNTSQYCNGAQILTKARCVVEKFDDPGQTNLAMWANGGDLAVVPEIQVVDHSWIDYGSNISYAVYAIHAQQSVEGAWNVCSSNPQWGSLVIPCFISTNISANVSGLMQEVSGSEWVTTWLEDFRDNAASSASGSGSGFKTILLAPIIGGAVVLIAAVVVAVCCVRRRQKRNEEQFAVSNAAGYVRRNSHDGGDQFNAGFYKKSNITDDDWRPTESTEATTTARWSADQTIQMPRQNGSEDNDSAGSNGLLKILFHDEHLVGKRVPYENLELKSIISRGAFGEVWLCCYQDQLFAAKRLLQNKQAKFDEIEEFVHEIQLSASLEHPNIVRVVGIAWNSLYNLTMLIDYLPTGDLQMYLRKQGDLMTWARDKIHIAIGIAKALEYLHLRETPLIHRDLKSRNVLLTRTLDPRLIDFGVSRRRMEETMTAGVGTPYWTAPEVLNGSRYTEQSDIYSFGVLLTELDTCQLPYSDAVAPDGSKLKTFQVLNSVMSGVLRPSFSSECPQRIRRLGVACLQHDATRRPTASHLVEILGG